MLPFEPSRLEGLNFRIVIDVWYTCKSANILVFLDLVFFVVSFLEDGMFLVKKRVMLKKRVMYLYAGIQHQCILKCIGTCTLLAWPKPATWSHIWSWVGWSVNKCQPFLNSQMTPEPGSINSHYFHIIGDGKINPIVGGLYTHYKDSY